MKRLVMIVATLTIITGVFLCTNTTYATNKAIDNETESKIVEIKENAANSLEDYKEKYDSDSYGTVAYIVAEQHIKMARMRACKLIYQ